MGQEMAQRTEPLREVKFCATRLDEVTLKGTFERYASLFHRQDLGYDVVMPGAFRESLAKRIPRDIKMLFQHDPSQPVGLWDNIYEDARGLFVRGRIMTDIARGREVLSMMRSGVIDGLSIGFKVEKAQREPHSRVRRLLKVDLWEISIVTFPMQPDARISTLKGTAFEAGDPTPREFERWLMHDAGFTRSEARALMRDGLKGLKSQRDARRPGHGWELQLAEQMTEAARLLRKPDTEKRP